MADARLTHPTRGTLELRQRQTDDDTREVVANIANELGVDRPSLVHTETRERERSIRGLVTGPRRARDDPETDDWRQALANYIDLLESHVDEFQGDGYTFEDDLLDVQKRAVLESVNWSLSRGQPNEVEYQATVLVGRGTFEDQPIERRNPTVDDTMDTLLRVDGIDLPGFRDYQVQRSVGISPAAIFDRESAENNDNVIDEGVQQSVVFEGTLTGTAEQRASTDAALDALAPTSEPVTLETKFPGYSLEGFVVNYESGQESRFGSSRNDYRIEFVEGTKS